MIKITLLKFDPQIKLNNTVSLCIFSWQILNNTVNVYATFLAGSLLVVDSKINALRSRPFLQLTLRLKPSQNVL